FTCELIVENYLSGRRIDTFLARHFRNYTPYRMQRLVRAGQVRVEGLPAECSQRVFKGQRVWVRLIEPPDKLVLSEPSPVDVLYDDPWLMIVNKAPDQVAHPGGLTHSGTLLAALQHYLDQQTPLRGLLRPGIVHRLDRFTSGLLIATKEHLSHRRLTMHFERRKVFKSYLAITWGVIEEDYQLIDRPLGIVEQSGRRLVSVRADAHQTRPAWTEVVVLERFRNHTLVAARPLTGRLHQIRVHLVSVGHPILGDEFYGTDRYGLSEEEDEVVADSSDGTIPADPHDSANERRAAATFGPVTAVPDAEARPLIARQALHAHQLCFRHPITEEWMTFEAPLPEDMRIALQRLRSDHALGKARSQP
ncbi:MAG TPA: RluA family pseudouridine synthase, partial [Planctomycetaceae bacterium]|nr:RluA family pseudouridine synthase [Planctomycetaceae bacterium]